MECPSLKYHHQNTMRIGSWKFYLTPTLTTVKLPSKDRCRHNAVQHLLLMSPTLHTRMISKRICTASGCTRGPTLTCFDVHLIKTTKYVLKKQPLVHRAPTSTTSDVYIVSIHQIKDSEGLWPLLVWYVIATTCILILFELF